MKKDKKGENAKPLIERVRKADTFGEVKDLLEQSKHLQGTEKMKNGSIRFHGPTGMVSVHGQDHHKVKFGTKKQIILLAIKAGLLVIVVFIFLVLVL